jgi:hypothetical protein
MSYRSYSASAGSPRLSVVVIAYEMQRELPRTIRSLSPAMQLGVKGDDYELIVVDNGSAEPAEQWNFVQDVVREIVQDGVAIRFLRLGATSPSPAAAINAGLAAARAPFIGVMIDGARLASPGLLRHAQLASQLHRRPMVATLGFHLGPDIQTKSIQAGYDQAAEDRLLASVDWASDGYRLLNVSSLAGSSAAGWFGPIAESNALFLPAELWHELGGFDERFGSPGGGLVNLDTFARACALPETQLVILLGEGTFHQLHGGFATNSPTSHWSTLHAEYKRLRGHDFSVSAIRPLYLGTPSPYALRWLEASARSARLAAGLPAPGADPRDARRSLRTLFSRLKQMPLGEKARAATILAPAAQRRESTDRTPPRHERDELRWRYVSMLKKSLLNETALEAEVAYFAVRDALQHGETVDDVALYDVRNRMPEHFRRVEEAREAGRYFDRKHRNIGFAYTMIGRRRLENIEHCVVSVLDEGVQGDLVECGVWRGGAAILMRGILAAWGSTDRTVWVADSFAGLPAPELPHDTLDLSAERRPELIVSLRRVQENFALYDLLDSQVRFLEGWFKDTLPGAPIGAIAVLRLDGDLYESTMTSLTALYDRVSPGGFVIIDDYNRLPSCRAAVDDYRAPRGIADPIIDIDWAGAYWRKSS